MNVHNIHPRANDGTVCLVIRITSRGQKSVAFAVSNSLLGALHTKLGVAKDYHW
jgi:hypothetical protein